MPSTPRTFSLLAGYEGARHKWFVTGASHEPGPFEEVQVIELEPTLDLLERTLRFGGDHTSAEYAEQGKTINAIEALLREHGRLGGNDD